MAPRRKESAISLCDRAVVLGNSIAIRLLEYLSTVKHQILGVRDLAGDFLDVGRILWIIESGLKASEESKTVLPADLISELEKRFRQTNDDFIVLNQLVTRFLENDRKSGFARFSKGFKMMFADSDVNKMRNSLEKTREALRMSALVFKWSMGEDDVDATIGIGYTGLAAALDRMAGNASSVKINKKPSMIVASSPRLDLPTLPAPAPQDPLPELPRTATTTDRIEFPMPPSLPPLSYIERSSHNSDFMGSSHRFTGTTATSDEFSTVNHSTSMIQQYPGRAPSTIRSARSSREPNHPMLPDIAASDISSPRSISHSNANRDSASTHTTATDTLLEDLLSDVDINEMTGDDGSLGHVTKLKADPSTVPRWSPRSSVGKGNLQYKAALVQAVQKKNYSAIEQLLDRGVEPDSVTDMNVLREAVMLRDTEAVRLLLLFGADPNAVDRNNCTPLFSATELGFLDAARMLIKYGADPNQSAGPNSDTPLALAVFENKFDLVQLLLMYGGNTNQIMANGNTALIRAIDRNTPKRVIELILNYGGDPNIKNAEGTSPMFQSVSVQRLDIATLLLERGADPNLPGPKHLLWPSAYHPPFLRLLLQRGADFKKAPGIMELATSVNNIESVRTLLNAGVDPNAKKDGVYTPLCSAIRDNRGDIVTLLLANGADPNTPASEYPCFKCVTHHRSQYLQQLIDAGGDPEQPRGIIEKAVQHNNQDSLIFLLDYGVNVNAKSMEGWTPLTTAIRENRSDMVDLLLARGADPALRGQDWPINMAVKRPHILKKLLPSISNPKMFKGVVEMAVCADQLESIKLLLSAGFSVEDKNGGVFSPLTSAIREGNKEITHYLIDEAGADVNAPGEHLPIIKAIRRMRGNDTELLELLLERGADINLMYRGWNAVLQAVENGDANVLRLLVEKGNGIDLDLTDENGRTILDIVNGHGWDEAVQIINNSKNGRR
ncbi:ankyrin repeat-containing domain protein [Coniella lustricola]|uniref:Ankyrin repeat-containing domain protein n=1 Tax=Coniella lustricola TaxID=2025994 RepID=A0A2T2ZZ68_9PEZI|nr:ankyrin repeat-containing domain protein [Coniella lustricola]